MRNLIKKRFTTLILLAITTIIFMSLVGCGGFDEDNAKKESKIQLDSFLKVAKNGEFICDGSEILKVRDFVDKNCNKYFTTNFIKITKSKLSTPSYANNVFYLSNALRKVCFFNNYKISSPTVDKENETVTYELKTSDVGFAQVLSIGITMKKEDGKWKIDKTDK